MPPKAKPSPKKKTTKKAPQKTPTTPDPTSDEALLALSPDHAAPPDIPVEIAAAEAASLARLAAAQAAPLAKIGITTEELNTGARLARRLAQLEAAWQRARGAVVRSAADNKLLAEAEALDAKLVAGGRWACRDDAQAQQQLTRISEGSGLLDTVRDLGDLLDFWSSRRAALANTDITAADLTRAKLLVGKLRPIAEKEPASVDAALAFDLRNRAFWMVDAWCNRVREGGRYAFRNTPKLAAKFVSRYRVAAVRRARAKAKRNGVTVALPVDMLSEAPPS